METLRGAPGAQYDARKALALAREMVALRSDQDFPQTTSLLQLRAGLEASRPELLFPVGHTEHLVSPCSEGATPGESDDSLNKTPACVQQAGANLGNSVRTCSVYTVS